MPLISLCRYFGPDPVTVYSSLIPFIFFSTTESKQKARSTYTFYEWFFVKQYSPSVGNEFQYYKHAFLKGVSLSDGGSTSASQFQSTL